MGQGAWRRHRQIWACLVAMGLLGVVASGPVAAAGSGTRKWAFQPGERLTYLLKWTVVPAGQATLEVLPPQKRAGHQAHHFALTARSNAFVDAFFKVRDRIDAYADPAMRRSLGYRKRQHEGNTQRDVTVTFDWTAMTAQYTNKGDVRAPIPIVPGTFDPLSVFYWSRSAPLSVGGLLQRPVTDGKKLVIGVAHVIREETVTVPAGTFDTFLIEPDLAHVGGVFEKSPDAGIQVWVSADDRRLPVKLKSKVIVGSFSGELVAFVPGKK
jgi:hypothetical protein